MHLAVVENVLGSLLIHETKGKIGGHKFLSVAAGVERLVRGVVETITGQVICRHKSKPSTVPFLA
jgi:hypothetical protein